MEHRIEGRRLGKHPYIHNPKHLQMARYVTDALPVAPPSKSWTPKCRDPWTPMGNIDYGDCPYAAQGHAEQVWTANDAGLELTVTEQQVLDAYAVGTGFKPSDPQSDRGDTCAHALKMWQQKGIGGRKIQAYVEIEPGNHEHVRQCVCLAGVCYIGLDLPVSAQSQKVWSVVKGSTGQAGSWGGHCVVVVAYSPYGLWVVSWGELYFMTWGFWNAYCDEGWLPVGNSWVGSDKRAPNGLLVDNIIADAQLLAAA